VQGKYLYQKVYCARGDMENRIKECQLDLYAGRASTATMRANQLRGLPVRRLFLLVLERSVPNNVIPSKVRTIHRARQASVTD
jgi:hypothetical protein